MNNNNIPLDIISDILLRLPIKSIGRLKCVSKSWRCLISESRFVKMHLRRSISNNSDDDDNTRIIFWLRSFSNNYDNARTIIMLTNPSQVEPPMDLNGFFAEQCKLVVDSGLTPIVGDGFVVGSCHGLFLVDGESVFVCNPCTREYRELPKLTNIAINNNDPYFAGIGYDSYSDDYKVLTSGSVFSLKNNSWKTLPNIPCDYHCRGVNEGVFFDGSLYWMVWDKPHNPKSVILRFDLDTEQFLESPQLQLPPAPDGLCYEHLFVMGTHLSVFLYGHYQWKHEVWVLKKQGAESVWTKSFVVVYQAGDYYVRPICLLKSGELLLHQDDLRLVLYNPKDGTTRSVVHNHEYTLSYVYGYIESLISPYRVHESGLGEQ